MRFFIQICCQTRDVVGKINVIEDGKTIMKIDATVDKNVDRASIVTIYGRNMLDIISGNI